MDAEARAQALQLAADERELPGRRAYVARFGPVELPDVAFPEGTSPEDWYGEGKRAERRGIFCVAAAQAMKGTGFPSDDAAYAYIGKASGGVRSAMDYMITAWDKKYRPKTWVDGLSTNDQKAWAEVKRVYNNKIHASTARVEAAKEEYRRIVGAETHAQMVEREKLKMWLERKGVTDAKIQAARGELEELRSLVDEFQALGVPLDGGVSARIAELEAGN